MGINNRSYRIGSRVEFKIFGTNKRTIGVVSEIYYPNTFPGFTRITYEILGTMNGRPFVYLRQGNELSPFDEPLIIRGKLLWE